MQAVIVFANWIFQIIFSFHVVRFELKIAVTLPLTEEKWRANFDSRLRISIEEADGAFENRLREGWCDQIFIVTTATVDEILWRKRLIAHLKSKSTSPIVFQIHFQNQFSWVKLLIAVGRGRSVGVATISIFEGKETGRRWFCRAKFKIILRSETEKRFWHGNVDLKITAQLVTLLL